MKIKVPNCMRVRHINLSAMATCIQKSVQQVASLAVEAGSVPSAGSSQSRKLSVANGAFLYAALHAVRGEFPRERVEIRTAATDAARAMQFMKSPQRGNESEADSVKRAVTETAPPVMT